MAEWKLHFWNWDEPVLLKAVKELTRGWSGGALDLAKTVIIVPTGEAVRRLREALALHVSEKNGAVFAPYVWHPELAVTQNVRMEGIASTLCEKLAWSRALMDADLATLTALFPNPPEEKSPIWAASVAKTLHGLRHTLGAGGLTIKDVGQLPVGMEHDSRWDDLVRLEAAYLNIIRQWNKEDMQEAKCVAASLAELPEGVERVLVFAVPDAPELFRRWLAGVSATRSVEIFVHAPEDARTGFDQHGAPLVSTWGEDAGVVLPLAETQIHRASGPEDQARLAASLLQKLATRGCNVAVGSADPLLNSVLAGIFNMGGARVYNPAGRAARQHVMVQVLRDGWRAKHQPAWRAWLPFLRHHDVLTAVSAETGTLPVVILEMIDDFHQQHLPATLEDALTLSHADVEFKELHAVLAIIVARSELWAQSSSADGVRAFLEWIYGARDFDTSLESDRDFGDLCSEAIHLAGEVDVMGGGEGWFSMALDALEERPLGDLHGEADLVLHGWLELLWEPARGLVIAGFNDEQVPGIVTVDPFLPDHVREKLGLSCQSRRRARDAYLLRAMHEQRRADEGLHVIFGHVNAEGDVLRPSRLLLDCTDNNLPSRVKYLFPDELAHAPTIARPGRSLAFALQPEFTPWKKNSVSPSDLKSYLACPFRFYLAKVLRLKEVDSGQRELSAADMGNIMHEVLRAFACYEEMKDSRHVGDMAGWLVSELEKRITAGYGAQPLFSIALQMESMCQRLRKFAEVQAGLREEGWRIIAAEERITPEWDIRLGDVILSGKIDRIDRNDKTGAIRVIDYKTSASERGPVGGHVKKASLSDLENEQMQWQCFDDAQGKPQRWVDLQLPLYALAATKKWPDATSVDAAYICLPATVEGIELKVWKREAKSGATWNDELLASANWCAKEAVRRMSAGIFWPPAEDMAYDDFADLLLGDASAAVLEQNAWRAIP